MRRHMILPITLVVGLLATVAVASCTAALGAADQAVCGTYGSVQLTVTLTTRAPTFYLATPATALSGNANCETDFSLTWGWADTARARRDPSPPPLNNLSHVFQADAGISYFPYTTAAARDLPFDWYIDHSDHNAGSTETTVYLITTALTSAAAAADSILVIASIDYYH